MASQLQHLRSSTANKRPTASGLIDGRIAINTASGSPGLFFKDNSGTVIKVGPVHVGSGAPNASPASGGSSGNSIGEQWLDNSGGNYVFKIWDGSAWRSETGEFVNASGDTMTGDLVMNDANIVFEGSTEDGYETTLTVVDPTADRTITFPNITGTVVTTGDSGTVTSTMIASGTIVNADVNASAAIAGTKIDSDFGSQTIETTGVINAGAGTSAAPSVSVGTTDNGLYSPGTDEVAISTNGTGRLFISDDGKVGIGVSDPSSYNINADDLVIADPNGFNSGISINITDNTGSSNIYFGDSDAEARGQISYGHGADALYFYVGGNQNLTLDDSGGLALIGGGDSLDPAFFVSGSAPSNSLFVNSSGNVGIGAPVADVALHVDGDIRCDGIYGEGDANTSIQFPGSDVITFNEGGAEAARIDNSGRLLVGYTSQVGGSLLQVNDDRIRIASSKTPASASDTGTAGEVCWDSDYIYVAVGTNTWKRAALSTW